VKVRFVAILAYNREVKRVSLFVLIVVVVVVVVVDVDDAVE
jgi:hypothetical protein